MHLSTVSDWLTWIERIHPTEIELGLDRVKSVAERLELLSNSCPVIIVGGTNGKGSTVFGLEAIYRAAGYHTGIFTSPFLFKHNEQVRIDGQMVSDETLCDAFAHVEKSRGDITLTPFEFFTLAALLIFKSHTLDVLILEVGLGGRLDAVNIIDADIAVVTNISIDHVNWLGTTREKIAYEKAGIFRKDRPAVCGDINPPHTLLETAHTVGAPFYYQAHDFSYIENATTWSWDHQAIHYTDLPINTLATQNMSVVLMVVTLLQQRLAVSFEAILKGLNTVTVPGRIQIVEGKITEIYDVAHNPASVALLKGQLNKIPCSGKTIAVFSMLGDKDVKGSLGHIRESIHAWYVAPLHNKRAATMEVLKEAFQCADIRNVSFFPTITEAYQAALQTAQTGDRLVIFGSFHTVADVWRCRYSG